MAPEVEDVLCSIVASRVRGEEVTSGMLSAWINALPASLDMERRLRLFAADCAARVANLNTDKRVGEAIVAARRVARGEIAASASAAASAAASASASYASSASAASASFAASYASFASASASASAASASSSASASASAAYASSSAAYASASSSASFASSFAASSFAAERTWQRNRLVLWISDSEPEDWPTGPATPTSTIRRRS